MQGFKFFAGAVALALAWFGAEAAGQATITEKTVDGQPQVVMENKFVRLAFSPNQGGECAECLYKPTNTSFVQPRTGSLLGNRLWNYSDSALYTQWQTLPWGYDVQRGQGEVSLVLRARGKEDFTWATTFERRIVLRDDEAMARITYSLIVGQELMAPAKVGLWFCNSPRVPGEEPIYTFPLDTGILTCDPTTMGGKEAWLYNPARGWAAISGKSGTGICFNMEYQRLMCFYAFAKGQTTVEWAFRTTDVPNGKSVSTEALLVPFTGVKAVHGSGGGAVAGFEAPDRCSAAEAQAGLRIRATLTSGVAQSGELVVSLKPLPNGDAQPVYRGAVTLKAGELAAVDMTAKPPREGTWLLIGQFLRNGREMMDFVKPVIVGKESGPVRIEPKEARLGTATERFEDRVPVKGVAPKDIEISTAVETPHVEWAKPYRGGRLKVLVLTSWRTGREAVELAQRLDMEILWVTAGTQYELEGVGYVFGREGSYRVEHMNEYIKQTLKQPCDAVIIGGLPGNLFSDDVLDLLRRKVGEGMGLVYVTPVNGNDKLYSFLPVEKETSRLEPAARWSALQPHYITSGVPLAELPETGYALYKAKGQVVAAVGNAPLLITQEGPNKGRVAVFTYNTSWRGAGSVSTGITPWIEGDSCAFRYWEYYFSMLSKALIWAAHREQPVRLETVTTEFFEAPQLVMTLENAGEAMSARAVMSVSNAYGREEYQGADDVVVAKGEAAIRLSMPGELAGGLHFADVILRDKDGKVITWGSATFRTPETAKITGIAFDKRAYHPGETATATVALLRAEPPQPLLLRAEWTDGLGRLLARAEQHVDDVKQTSATFSLPIGKPLATTATLRVTTIAGDRAASVAEAQVITFPERFVQRSWDDWAGVVWGSPAGSYAREYLVPAYARAFKNYGASVVFGNAGWQTRREYEWAVRAGFQIMAMSVSFGYLNVGHQTPQGKMSFQEQQKKYLETRDKQYLIRPVSLNDPADLEPLATQLRQVAEYAGWLEPIGYNLGDEISVTYYGTPFDYDFHPAALAGFRAWLKTRYVTLDALNREWDTRFNAWDDVLPMTALEVKDRGNYAPWADHREFMDDTFAHFFEWTRDQLRVKDPRAGVSVSGTQAAEAYGGYDWSKLGRNLDSMLSYTVFDTPVMHRSFSPSVPSMPYYGYSTRNPDMRNVLWQYLLIGGHGATFFKDICLFRPDLLPSPIGADSLPVVREFQAGLAKQIRQCSRVCDIGIHYSHSSIRGAYITGAEDVCRNNRAGWIAAFDDLGFQCEYLSSRELEDGELSERNYRAFVLPYSVALSEKEASALRRYVEGGGLLIADAKPGLMDEHCNVRQKAVLEELFGVNRGKVDPSVFAREGEARFTRDSGRCKLNDLKVDVGVAEPNLKIHDGEAFGAHEQTPLCIVRRAGKGTAVFLNMYMESYPQRRSLNAEAALRRIPENVLRLNGLEPAAKAEIKGFPQAHMLTVRYTNGEAFCVASRWEYDGKQADTPAPLRLTFPKTGFVYDLRNGKALGQADSAESSIRPGDAVVYAVLPYEVKSVTVVPQAARATAGTPVQYAVTLPDARGHSSMHVVLVDVIGPDGKARSHYGAQLVARDGKAVGEFVPALNDEAGRWTIRATDFVSRAAGVADIELR